MLQKISDPLGISNISFPAWHRFDMLCVNDQDLEISLKEIEYRFPIDPR
jgi:hypothetical protein